MDMTLMQQLVTIAMCVLGTMATRYIPFLLFPPGKQTPPYVQYLGKVLPSAVFALLVVYCLKDVSRTAELHGIPEALALVVTGVLHVWRRQMFLSMAAGTILYMVLVQTVFAG